MILVVLVIGMIILKVTLRKVVPMKISKNLLDLELQTAQQVPRLLPLLEWLLVQLLVESLWQVIWNYIFHPPLGMLNGKAFQLAKSVFSFHVVLRYFLH